MFLAEKELRDTFWRNYNYNNRALRYQFEIEFRTGATDLLTLERFQRHYQLNSFEFKLADVKKAIAHAEKNAAFVNKSWIVVPAEKKELLFVRYRHDLQDVGAGAIIVEEGGRWSMAVKPRYRECIQINQKVLDFIIRGIPT